MNQYRAPYINVTNRKIMWQLTQEVPIGGEPAKAQVLFEQLHL